MWFYICDFSSVSLIYVFVLVLLHDVFITMALRYSLKPCIGDTSALFLLLRISLGSQEL